MNVQRLSVRDWLDKWLNEYKIHNLKRSTYDNYLSLINEFVIPHLGNIRLDKLCRDDVHELYSHMTEDDYSSSTVHGVHKILQGALEQAIIEGKISVNPCYKMSLPKLTSKEKIPLTENETEKLLAILKVNSYDNGILFMLNSGLRVGEMLALKWDDIDFENKNFSVKRTLTRTSKITSGESDFKTELIFETPKTRNSNRTIPLSTTLADVLMKQKEYLNVIKSLKANTFKEAYIVFSAENGSPIDPRNFNRHLISICKNAGINKIGSHIFRHTFISNAVKNKVDPRFLKRIVGHANVNMTDSIYTHLDVDDLRDTMEKIK